MAQHEGAANSLHWIKDEHIQQNCLKHYQYVQDDEYLPY
jgi:hypothetical protein